MCRYFTTFIFLCVLATATKAQSFATADSLFAARDYERAAMEYERCVFLSESRATTHDALLRKAQCYKQAGRYDRAAATLERCARDCNDYAQLALCHYLAADFAHAVAAVEDYRMLADSIDENVLIIQVLALNELGRYDSALAIVQSFMGHQLDSCYAMRPQLKNMKTTHYLSFVPGLGHVYAGQAGLGIAAFTLNAAVLGFAVWQAFEHCWITAWLGGAGLLSATWPGSMRSAEYYARKYNYDLSSKYNAELRSRILQTQSSISSRAPR